MLPALAHVDSWIFDLDNSLYPASADLFALIDLRMGDYIARLLGCDADEARRVQKSYFRDHGTTLSGLMHDHGVDPSDFLDFVHDIDLDRLTPDPALPGILARLPGRKFVFTNGDERHARRVLDRLGIGDAFDGLHDIHAMDYVPKPDPRCYAELCRHHGIVPGQALFVEDMARNLKPAKALGMATVWIDNGSDQAGYGEGDDFIDYVTDDIGRWLEEIMREKAA